MKKISFSCLIILLTICLFPTLSYSDTDTTNGTLVAIFTGESQDNFTSSWIVVLDIGKGSTYDDCTPQICHVYICQPTAECVTGGYEIGRTYSYITSLGPNFDGCKHDFVWKISTGEYSGLK